MATFVPSSSSTAAATAAATASSATPSPSSSFSSSSSLSSASSASSSSVSCNLPTAGTSAGSTLVRDKMDSRLAKLIQTGDDLLEQFNLPAAVQFFERALKENPKSVTVLNRLGEVYLEMGEPEKAKMVLLRSTELSPGENGMKWMSLGQLCAAKEAMHCYRNGISVLERDPEANRAELVRAYCASAELYMTDLCFEADAEKGCEAFLEKAIKLDSDNAEALSAMASLRLSQGKDAKNLIHKVYTVICRCLLQNMAMDEDTEDSGGKGKGTNKDVIMGDGHGQEEDRNSRDIALSFDFRCSVVKMLIETSQIQEALDLLDGLALENDESAHVWYLMGIAHTAAAESVSNGSGKELNDRASASVGVTASDGSGRGNGFEISGGKSAKAAEKAFAKCHSMLSSSLSAATEQRDAAAMGSAERTAWQGEMARIQLHLDDLAKLRGEKKSGGKEEGGGREVTTMAD